jgi:hypothetical protein
MQKMVHFHGCSVFLPPPSSQSLPLETESQRLPSLYHLFTRRLFIPFFVYHHRQDDCLAALLCFALLWVRAHMGLN